MPPGSLADLVSQIDKLNGLDSLFILLDGQAGLSNTYNAADSTW